jgi:hypothetical protein
VEDVRPANGHNSSQTSLRPNVSQDHWLHATVLAEDQLKDTHARDVNQELSKIQTTSTYASSHTVTELIKSESQLTQPHAEDVKIANGQDTFQTTRELNAF